eukprot:563152_1
MASVSSTDSFDSTSLDSINSTDLTPVSTAPLEYQEIFENVYVSRRKRVVKEDDIYECNCDPRKNEFCDVGCLNRMYSAECNPEYCPLGKQCHNRRFQNREWCQVEIRPAGKKGWGLFANQNIKKDTFVIEYIGEIIDSVEVKTRLRYTYFGAKKFFILSLGAGYLIDATLKGSNARFMNHSCSPNCYTQKWTVLGERCIGFFALCDIDKDEELTFDYQFQRYGEDKHPCYCGSDVCRKWLGASKPSNASHTTHTAVHHSHPKIIYRKMNPQIQMKRHMRYHKRLMDVHVADIKPNAMFKQLMLKGSVCKAMTNDQCTCNVVRDNHCTVQFDHVCYRMLNVKKNVDLDTLQSIAQSMRIHKTLPSQSNGLLHQLYGDCIDEEEEEETPPTPRIPKRQYNVYQKPVKPVLASPISVTTPVTPCSEEDAPPTTQSKSYSDAQSKDTNSNSNAKQTRKRRRSDTPQNVDYPTKPCKRQKMKNAFASDSEHDSRNGYAHRNYNHNHHHNHSRNANYNYNHNYNQYNMRARHHKPRRNYNHSRNNHRNQPRQHHIISGHCAPQRNERFHHNYHTINNVSNRGTFDRNKVFNNRNYNNKRFRNKNSAHRNHWNVRGNRHSFNHTPQRRNDWRVRPQQREMEKGRRRPWSCQYQEQHSRQY